MMQRVHFKEVKSIQVLTGSGVLSTWGTFAGQHFQQKGMKMIKNSNNHTACEIIEGDGGLCKR